MNDSDECKRDEKKHESHKWGVDVITVACSAFLVEHERLLSLFAFINDAAVIADQRETGQHTQPLVAVGGSAPPFDRVGRPGVGALNEFRSHANAIFQIWLARTVDNYLVYLSELLAEILTRRPELLRASETVSAREVLSHLSAEALIQSLAEKRVHSWVRDGVRNLTKKFQTHLKFDLFHSPDQLDKVIEAIAIRNAIAHNRGLVDERFLAKVSSGSWELGKQVALTDMYVFGAMRTLKCSVEEIDARALVTFDLRTSYRG